MKAYELFTLFKPLIDAGLSSAGIDAVLTQEYQPTDQGVEPLTTVAMQIVGSHRYGWVHRNDIWNAETQLFDHVETQQMETTFQVGCLQKLNPESVNQDTAIDILQTVAAVLQNSNTIETIEAVEVGILRITDIRNPYFRSDTNQFQASPSFDFTVTHKQITILTTPKIDTFQAGVYPV